MSNKALARIAGLLYLVVAVFGGFAEYVRTSATVAGDAAATAANVVQQATLFRIGFVADLIDGASFLAVALILYAILRPVSPRVAVAMLVINAVSVALQAANMLNQAGALLAATDPRFAAGMSAAGFLEMHRIGYLIAQIYFGGYLLPLGYLVYRSGLFPRILGAVLVTGSAAYLLGVAFAFASPGLTSGLATPLGMVGGIAELIFLLWLIVMGAKEQPAAAEVKGALRWSA